MRAMTQLPDISIAIGGTVQMMFEKLQQRKKSNNVYNIQTHLFRSHALHYFLVLLFIPPVQHSTTLFLLHKQ